MIKKWIYRIIALGFISFALLKTREYYKTRVADYKYTMAEQRRIWDEKGEEYKNREENKTTKAVEEGKSQVVSQEENEPAFDFEPSEATGDDFYLDLSTYGLWESGEYSFSSGDKTENKRRLRYPQLIEVECPLYCVVLSEGYILNISEFDAEGIFLRSLEFVGGDKYEVSKNCSSFSITLHRKEAEKSLSPGQWNGIFGGGEGIEIIVCTPKRLEQP